CARDNTIVVVVYW
nr:immunoglobulin heavy chain junction region [Macaca mulatta]